jgi:hypothetical protein
MGWNDHLDDSPDFERLPPEAYDSAFGADGSFDPNDLWLKSADPELQEIAMRLWFQSRYCDPAMDTPYNGGEGGYLFIHGGPFDPADEIPARFSGIVDDSLIENVVDALHGDVGDEWAPIQRDPPDGYDERFGLYLEVRNEPLARLRNRLQQAQQVLTLQGPDDVRSLAERMVFSAAIGTLESFLWETAHYWIENDEGALRDFVTKLPQFRDEKIKLGDIFARHAGLKAHVKGYLQNLVWHRFDKVIPLFRDGLGIDLPSVASFNNAMTKRHDIVHRSGHDKDGNSVSVTREEIDELCASIERFAVQVDTQLAKRGTTNMADDIGVAGL